MYHPAVLRRRFEIQDIVAQDSSGVTFHALDVQTGSAVAVRRFFPFGADGGGLFDEERSDYTAFVARLTGLQHPGLREVLSGGCDPVDGMPFVASEWIEGETLAEFLQRGTFTSAEAVVTLERVLEICEGLSNALGADAVWVETAPELIIDDAGDSHRGLTFGLAPMKWLGHEASQRSLLPLAELAEDMLGWRRRRLTYQVGHGLGAWVKWVRANADGVTLRQARERLVDLAGGSAPEAASGTLPCGGSSEPRQPLALPIRLKKNPVKEPWILIAVVGLLAAGAVWWVLLHPVVHGVRGATPARTGQQAPAVGELPGTVLSSGDTQRIMQQANREVTVEGVLKKVEMAAAGDVLYLEFEGASLSDEVRGCFESKIPPDDMTVRALNPLQGKRIRISGVVEIRSKLNQWPEVRLKDRQSIQEVK